MKDGVLLCNAGHFDVEICIPDLAEPVEVDPETRTTSAPILPVGRSTRLAKEGLSTLPQATHPVEIMDMSHDAAPLMHYISSHKLGPGLYTVPANLTAVWS